MYGYHEYHFFIKSEAIIDSAMNFDTKPREKIGADALHEWQR